MNLTIFPPPGYEGEKFWKPVENNWHVIHLELKKQLIEAGFEVSVYPCPVDVKSDIGIYIEHQPIVPLCEKSLLIMLEPPVIRPRQYEFVTGLNYTRILTYVRSICDDKAIFFSPFPVPSYDAEKLKDIQRDKYIVAISGYVPPEVPAYNHPEALYKARELAYLSWGKDLDLYGHRWHQWPHVNEVNYLGTVHDKVAKLAEYKFCLCFENWPGFNSEKLYHCVQAGTIPLYRGNKDEALPLSQVTEVPWCARIVRHVREIKGGKDG